MTVRRSVALAAANVLGLIAFTWPFALPAAVGNSAAHEIDAPFIVVGLLICLGTLLFVELGRGGMGAKHVALIGVLGAAMVALRLPGFVGGFSAMFIVVLLAGNAFGPAFGFVLGATGTFASGLFVGGLGPWLPFQMVAVGWVGAGAGMVRMLGPRSGWGSRVTALAVYGFAAAFAFGAIMNLWFWPFGAGDSALGWSAEAGAVGNLGRYVRFYMVTSFGWDVFGAIGNATGVAVLGRPLLAALDRAARRMRLDLDNGAQRRESAGWPRPGSPGRGKSGLHRAGRWGKSQAGRPAESATESRPPGNTTRVRVKG